MDGLLSMGPPRLVKYFSELLHLHFCLAVDILYMNMVLKIKGKIHQYILLKGTQFATKFFTNDQKK